MRVGQGGDGPGPHTPDGSAVELYELAPVTGEDEVLDAAIEPGSTILELGCGTGRITRPLLALGHQVVAVDESPQVPEMLQGPSVREKGERRFVISDVEHLPGNRQDLGPRQAHLSL